MTYYVQSPLGLVPKAGNKTHLIFHLSYDFGPEEAQKSINWHTLDHLCTVKYNDLDQAVHNSLCILRQTGESQLWYVKSDCSNAFHIVPGHPSMRYLLTIKARHPITKCVYYFIDKCLTFGASISCAIFQAFSDALKYIVEWRICIKLKIQPALTNYLDDFLFLTISALLCNKQVKEFPFICQVIGCLISMDKTKWASKLLTFLGILLNGKMLTLSVPLDKKIKARNLLLYAIQKRKVTIKFIQQIMGVLNFLNRAIVPGRAFTQGMYRKLTTKNQAGQPLKAHHHVYLNLQFILDCRVWLAFLQNSANFCLCQPYIDLDGPESVSYQLTDFHSDTSKNKSLGIGTVFDSRWLYGSWPQGFIELHDPSIEFLELYALTVAVITWEDHYAMSNR